MDSQLFDINIEKVSAIISIIPPIIGLVFWQMNRFKKAKNAKDLSDFFDSYKAIWEYKNNYVKTQGIDRPPDEEDEPIEAYEASNRKPLIDFFFKQVFNNETKRIYLILGGAGMGKTTFLINLFIKYNSLIFSRKYRIKYIPLSDPSSDEFINKYKNDGSPNSDGSDTILLLDALDEDIKLEENYEQRIYNLISQVRTFRKVIITCRTQFFPEEEREKFGFTIPNQGKDYGVKKIIIKYIAPFNSKEINLFIRFKYKAKFNFLGLSIYLDSKRRLAEKIVEKASNLMARPMLLDHIDFLLNSDASYIYEYDIYRELVEHWIRRESIKQPHKTKQNFKEEMMKFMLECARLIYNNFINDKGLFLDTHEINKLSSSKDIDLTKLDVGTRSILNRNTKGRYKFSHKSILEYLLARKDAETLSYNEFISFEHFDFGKMLRDQIIFTSIVGRYQQVFYNFLTFEKLFQSSSVIGDDFERVKRDVNWSLIKSAKCLIVTNYQQIQIRRLRLFEELDAIIILDNEMLYNINTITLLKTQSTISSLRGNTDFYFTFQVFSGKKSRHEGEINGYLLQSHDDSFFENNKIRVFRILKTK